MSSLDKSPQKQSKANKPPKLCYSRICDLRFFTPGTTTYSSLAQPTRGKLDTRAHAPDQEHGTQSRSAIDLWRLLLPHLRQPWGVMLTATAKACGQDGGSISCPQNANEGVSEC